MHLTELTCDGFRALRDICFGPDAGMNVIRGDNAQGKTSLLEAVLFLATSKSHRTTSEDELPRHGSDGFCAAASFRRRDRDVRIEARWHLGAKRLRVNGVPQTRVSDILGQAHVVFFSPEDLALIQGGAGGRRRFLDMELAQLRMQYLHALQQYRLVLRQRNELLRGPDATAAMLAPWDEQLARHGTTLMAERRRFVEELSPRAASCYVAIAGEEPFSLTYEPDVKRDDGLLDALHAACESDRRQRMTTRGPHRDDIEFRVAGKPARRFGSQGQQRTAALAVRLAELELVRSAIGEYPVLMLDDVLSELDRRRCQGLLACVPPKVQCLLTTTDAEQPELRAMGADCAWFTMQAGRLMG